MTRGSVRHPEGWRVLLGVCEGEHYARQLAPLPDALPEAECRYLTTLRACGRVLRRLDRDVVSLPWMTTSTALDLVQDPLPPLAQITTRGYAPDRMPSRLRSAFSALASFVDREVDRFQPDVVVYGPMDHAMSYFLDRAAARRGTPRVGLEPCFLAEHVIAHSYGAAWQDRLRAADVDRAPSPAGSSGEAPSTRRIGRRRVLTRDRLARGFERLVRAFSGGVSFDTRRGFVVEAARRIVPGTWSSGCATLESVEVLRPGCVVVLLHQPALPAGFPSWADLVSFAVDAAPADLPLVIRPHPVERARALPEAVGRRLRARGNVHFYRPGHGPGLGQLLAHARAVLTLTSAAGVEALLAGVPVFALGPAFYGRPGMARLVRVEDARSVSDSITSGREVPDADAVRRFLRWLADEHIIPAPQSDLGARALAARVRLVKESD